MPEALLQGALNDLPDVVVADHLAPEGLHVGSRAEGDAKSLTLEVDWLDRVGDHPRTAACLLDGREHLWPRVFDLLELERRCSRLRLLGGPLFWLVMLCLRLWLRWCLLRLVGRGWSRSRGNAERLSCRSNVRARDRSLVWLCSLLRRRLGSCRRRGPGGLALWSRCRLLRLRRLAGRCRPCLLSRLRSLARLTCDQEPREHELKVQLRARGAGHARQRLRDDVGSCRQPCRAELVCAIAHPFDLVFLRAMQQRLGVVAYGRNDEVAQVLEQVFDETTGVLPRLDNALDCGERGGCVASGERLADGVEQLGVGEAEQRDRELIGDGAVGSGDQLVEQAERVASGAAASAHHQRQHAGLDLDALFVDDRRDVVEQHARRDEPERIVVRARSDRADDLLGLGRREDELDVLWRLFDDLQQCVEAVLRDHVGLVDDVDLEAVAGRADGRALTQVAGVVDTTVAGSVDFDHVDRSAAVAAELDT